MVEKRIKIYIGSDLKPYIDKEHTKQLTQISDQTYIGENNATILDFDLSELSSFATALLNIKKPDNSISYEILEEKTIDGEQMYEVSLQAYYINQKGALIVSVNTYEGSGIEILGEGGSQYIELNGDEMLIATAPIKIYINYSPFILPSGKELTISDLQKILYAISSKVDRTTTINGKNFSTNIVLKAEDIEIDDNSIENTETIQEALEYLLNLCNACGNDITAIQTLINNLISGTQIAGKSNIAVKDEDERLLTSLETKVNVANEITKIKDGTYTSKKAEQDEDGTNIKSNYVKKTRTILGIDLSDDILLGEFKTALGNATESLDGLMSSVDKSRLNALHALLGTEEDSNEVVDTINEILSIFNNYPEGADILTALAGKVDKVSGKGLSTNDYTDIEKNKVASAKTHADIVSGNPHGTTKDNIGLGNVINPSVYGGTLTDNVDTIAYSGFYTCYSGTTGLSAEMNALGISFHIIHINSNVGTAGATQRAIGFNSSTLYIYERVKVSGTWGSWIYQPTKADLDNAVLSKSNYIDNFSNKIACVNNNNLLENTKVGEKIKLKIKGKGSTLVSSLIGTQNVQSSITSNNNAPFILCKSDGGFTITLTSGNKTANFISGHKYACIIEVDDMTYVANPQTTYAGCYDGSAYINFINSTSALIDTTNKRICISNTGNIVSTKSYSRIYFRLVLTQAVATLNIKNMVIIDLTDIGKDTLSNTEVYDYFKNSISTISAGTNMTFYSKLGLKISGKNLYNNSAMTYQNSSSKVSYSIQDDGIKVLLNQDYVSGSGNHQVNVLNLPLTSLNLSAGDLITLSCEKVVSLSTMIPNIQISFFNSSGTSLGVWTNSIYYSNLISTTKIPSGTTKISIIYALTNNDASAGNYAIFKNIQIEKGNNFSSFEQYYETDLGTVYDSSVDSNLSYKEVNILSSSQVLKMYQVSNSNYITLPTVSADYTLTTIMYNYLPNYSLSIEAEEKLEKTQNSYKLSFIKQISHRGFSIEAPENTLSAFKLAKKKGFNFVECDIQYTSDGVPVLLHDTSINRTSNGTGNISSLTYEQVRAYDFGSWKSSIYAGEKIPSFEEFLITLKRIGLNAYVEIKSSDVLDEQIQLIVSLVREYGMLEHIVFICTNISKLDVVFASYPKAKIGYVVDGDITSGIISSITSRQTTSNYIFLDCNLEKLTNDGITLAINAGIDLEVWTVDDINSILNMHTYITGITTNGFNLSKSLYDYTI